MTTLQWSLLGLAWLAIIVGALLAIRGVNN